jgi:hypothetical protein
VAVISRRKLLVGAGASLILPRRADALSWALATPPTIGLVTAGNSRQGCGGDVPFVALGNPSTGDCGVPATQAVQTYYSRATSVPILWRNMGISGTRLNSSNGYPDLVPLAPRYINPIPLASPFVGLDMLFVNGIGINDLLVGSFGNGHADLYAAACAALNVSVKTAMLANGARSCHTALETCPPSSSNGLVESNWEQFNGTLTTPGWAGANGVDFIIDLNSQPIVGAWNSLANPELSNDGLHYLPFAVSLLAPIFLGGVNTMIAMV